jgi:hypothetical protein
MNVVPGFWKLMLSIAIVAPGGLVSLFAIAPAEANPSKVGEVRSLPGLQTRARPPLLPAALYIGMTERSFFEYAKDNNWAAIDTIKLQSATSHHLLPGGEGVYALPNRDLVYARGFTAKVYFDKGRLVGMRLIYNPSDLSLTSSELLTLVRAWFPDDVLSVLYQFSPNDPKKRVLESVIGSLPTEFKQDLGQNGVRFCRTVMLPAPLPIDSAISSCS